MISIPGVGLTKIKNRMDESSSSSNDLLSMIEAVPGQQEGIDDDIDIFTLILMSLGAASSRDQFDSGEDHTDPARKSYSEAQVFARPVWRISLLYWASHCAVRSAEVQQFCPRLETGGALLTEPFLAELLTAKYQSMEVEGMVSKTLSSEERTRFTSAWMQTFPKFTIPLFPRAINAVLSIFQDEGFFRDGGPLSANELIRLSGILYDAIGPHRGLPNINSLLRTAERLQDASLLSSDGLVAVSQVLRTGRIFWENGLIIKDSLFSGQPFLTAGIKSDDARQKEAVLRGYKLFVDNGWINTSCGLPSKAGAGEGALDLTDEAFSLPDLFRNNGINISDMYGPIKDCKVM